MKSATCLLPRGAQLTSMNILLALALLTLTSPFTSPTMPHVSTASISATFLPARKVPENPDGSEFTRQTRKGLGKRAQLKLEIRERTNPTAVASLSEELLDTPLPILPSHTLTLNIPPPTAAHRVDKSLALLFPSPSFPRAFFSALCDAGGVKVDGNLVKKNYQLSKASVVELTPSAIQTHELSKQPAEENRVERAVASASPLTVIHDATDYLIINKPAGQLVHPGAGNLAVEPTVVGSVLQFLGERKDEFIKAFEEEEEIDKEEGEEGEVDDVLEAESRTIELPASSEELISSLLSLLPAKDSLPSRPGIVHRLDAGTSGALLVALTRASHTHLSSLFRDRTICKKYIAVVSGNLPIQSSPGVGVDNDNGDIVVKNFISRHPTQRTKFRVTPEVQMRTTAKGKFAESHIRLLAGGRGQLSVVEVEIKTGRSHQIRVHLAGLGCDIVGDSLYGLGAPSDGKRPMLHARELSFEDEKGKNVFVRAVIPEDFVKIVEDGVEGGGEQVEKWAMEDAEGSSPNAGSASASVSNEAMLV